MNFQKPTDCSPGLVDIWCCVLIDGTIVSTTPNPNKTIIQDSYYYFGECQDLKARDVKK